SRAGRAGSAISPARGRAETPAAAGPLTLSSSRSHEPADQRRQDPAGRIARQRCELTVGGIERSLASVDLEAHHVPVRVELSDAGCGGGEEGTDRLIELQTVAGLDSVERRNDLVLEPAE